VDNYEIGNKSGPESEQSVVCSVQFSS